MTDAASGAEPPAKGPGVVRRERARFTVASAGVAALAVVVSTLLLTVADPSAGESTSVNLALLGVPGFAVAVVLEALLAYGRRGRSPGWQAAWILLLAMPAAIYAVFLVAAPGWEASDPDYFRAEDAGVMRGVYAAFVFLLAPLVGPLLWFFLVSPVWGIVENTALLARRDPRGSARRYLPRVAVLALSAIILGATGALHGFGGAGGRLELVLALLGIPGRYEVASESLLWAVRGLVVLAGAGLVLALRARRGGPGDDEGRSGGGAGDGPSPERPR